MGPGSGSCTGSEPKPGSVVTINAGLMMSAMLCIICELWTDIQPL